VLVDGPQGVPEPGWCRSGHEGGEVGCAAWCRRWRTWRRWGKDDRDRSDARALRGIAAILLTRGLQVTETTSPDGLSEIFITNHAEPARGRIHVGPGGYLIWEYWAPAAAKSADAEIIGTVIATLGGLAH
jgi:hypothetical protein